MRSKHMSSKLWREPSYTHRSMRHNSMRSKHTSSNAVAVTEAELETHALETQELQGVSCHVTYSSSLTCHVQRFRREARV